MPPENQNTIIETKQMIALASVLFLAPAVLPILEANNIAISEEDKPFIECYLTYGKYLLYGIGLSIFILLLGKYIFVKQIIVDLSKVVSALIIIMVLVAIFAIIRKKQIIVDNKISRTNIISLVSKKNI